MTITAVIVVVALVAGVTALIRHHDRPPYRLSAVHPTLSAFRLITSHGPGDPRIHHAIEEMTGHPIGPTVDPMRRGEQYLLGRQTMQGHAIPQGASYSLVLIDNQDQSVMRAWSAPDRRFSLGWDGSMNGLSSARPWLGLLSQATDPTNPFAQSIGWSGAAPTNLTFYAPLSRSELPLTAADQHSALTIALLFTGPNGQFWDAQQLG